MLTIRDKEKLEYFKKIVPGHFMSEIRDLYNKKFNEHLTLKQVDCLKTTYKLKSNVQKLRKDEIKWSRLGKGVPIGTERIRKGYIEVKVKQPDIWRFKHLYLYEKEYGKIPKHHIVVFKDGNKMNCNINNLMLVNRKDLCVMNTYNLELNKGEELLITNILLSQLIQKTNKRKK